MHFKVEIELIMKLVTFRLFYETWKFVVGSSSGTVYT